MSQHIKRYADPALREAFEKGYQAGYQAQRRELRAEAQPKEFVRGPYRKVPFADVLTMRELWKQGKPIYVIARKFPDTSAQYVRNVVKGFIRKER